MRLIDFLNEEQYWYGYWIDPKGKLYDITGLSHAEWIRQTKVPLPIDVEEIEGKMHYDDPDWYDEDLTSALIKEGWTRIINFGNEMDIHSPSTQMVYQNAKTIESLISKVHKKIVVEFWDINQSRGLDVLDVKTMGLRRAIIGS